MGNVRRVVIAAFVLAVAIVAGVREYALRDCMRYVNDSDYPVASAIYDWCDMNPRLAVFIPAVRYLPVNPE